MKIETLFLMAAAVGSVACGDVSSAMSRGQSPQAAQPAATVPVASEPLRARTGNYEDGYQLGQHNGGIMVGRIQDRTVNTQGCSAIPLLEDTLIKVARTIRPPMGYDEEIARGFFRGYLDAIRKGVRDSRDLCGSLQYSDGGFAGALYGTVLCQVTKVNVDVVSSFEVESLYEGWSGGSSQVLSECRTAATVTLKDCGVAELSQTLELTVAQSCSDVSSAGGL